MQTVLVVDDEPGIAETLSELLSDEGFRAATAHDGREALRLVHTHQPDLILLDYMMPRMDGSEVLACLAADPVGRKIPVVMMSSVPKANLPAGCKPSAFLRKPFGVDELLATVNRQLAAAREN